MKRAFAIAIALSLLAGPVARAEVGAKDFQVIGRTLSLLASKPADRVTIAIIHDPALPASRAEAERVAAVLAGGLSVGGLTLVATLVPLDQPTALDGATAAWITQGLGNRYDALFEATRTRALLSITQDFACVRAARCVLGLETHPQVQILVNRQAAEASRVGFASAFRMLVSEI